MLVKSQNETNSSNSPPVQDKTQNPLKHIIPEDSIVVQRTLGTGEFGIVQQGVWTKETGEQVPLLAGCWCMLLDTKNKENRLLLHQLLLDWTPQ